MRRGEEITIDQFAGRASNLPETKLDKSQALELDNVVVLPNKQGFRTAWGNAAFNSSAATGAWQGLAHFQKADLTEYLVGVANGKFFKSDSLDGTWDDVTGSITLSAMPTSTYDLFTFGDAVVGFGGRTAPFTWTGTGNASALSGTPPSASFGFTYNNRVFAGSTDADPSTIYWSILGNAADWTGTGSGSAVVGSLNDNQRLVGAKGFTNDLVLLFKEASVYQMPTRNLVGNAFPIFPLHDKAGAAGKDAIVNVNDEIYFITPQGTMLSTNGARLKEYPGDADDLFEDIDAEGMTHIFGIHYEGWDHNWLIWFVPNASGTLKNYAIVWDLDNECWLNRSTGFKANVACTTLDGTLYTGHYDGVVYEQDVVGTKTEASEASAAVSWYWRIGWLRSSGTKTLRPQEIVINCARQNSGTITLTYGFDGQKDRKTATINLTNGWLYSSSGASLYGTAVYSGHSNRAPRKRLTGRGNTFNFKLSSSTHVEVQSISILGHVNSGQKDQTNP